MVTNEKPWSYEVDDNVIVWDITEWTDPTEEEMDEVVEELRRVAGRERVTASVSKMEGDVTLDPETMTYIEQNNMLYADLGLSKVGWVSDGIQGLALKSKLNETPGLAVKAFDELESAVSWAKE